MSLIRSDSLKLKISHKAFNLLLFVELGLFFFLQILGERYLLWGIDYRYVLCFLCISFVSLSKIIYDLFSKEATILTPTALFSIFILLFGFSFLPINESNVQLNTFSIFILFISMTCFLCGIHIGKHSKRIYSFFSYYKYGIFFLKGLSWLALCVFLMECMMIGYIPILNIFTNNVYGESNENALPLLHYFVQLANVIPIWFYILYKESVISKETVKKYVFLALFIAINSLSRQGWLLSILCFGIAYNFYNVVSRRKIIITAIFFLLLFGIIGAIRYMAIVTSGLSELEYLQAYAGTNYDTNMIETYLGLYSTNNFTTFDKFLNSAHQEGYYAFGAYLLRPLYSVTFLNKFDFFAINRKYDSLMALGTYAIEPYLDFGIIGVFVVNILYGYIAGYSYRNYKLKKYKWIMPWSIMAYCIIMSSFTNYYNTLFIWLIFIFNFLILSAKKTHISNIR